MWSRFSNWVPTTCPDIPGMGSICMPTIADFESESRPEPELVGDVASDLKKKKREEDFESEPRPLEAESEPDLVDDVASELSNERFEPGPELELVSEDFASEPELVPELQTEEAEAEPEPELVGDVFASELNIENIEPEPPRPELNLAGDVASELNKEDFEPDLVPELQAEEAEAEPEPELTHSTFLDMDVVISKTLSNQDVSKSLHTEENRVQVSRLVKMRPVSAYSPQTSPALGTGMTTSLDGAGPGAGTAGRKSVRNSRIPVPQTTTPVQTPKPTTPRPNQTPLKVSTKGNANSNNTTPVSAKANGHSNNTTPNSARVRPTPPPNSARINPPKKPVVPEPRPGKTDNDFIRPRQVNVIRHGVKPRKIYRYLLNKRTATTLDNVLSDLTLKLRADWGAVRKLILLDGTVVTTLKDLFVHGDTFVAYPKETVKEVDLKLHHTEAVHINQYIERRRETYQDMEPSRSMIQRRPKSSKSTPQPKPIKLPGSVKAKYTVGSIVGDGNFAVVRSCTHKLSGQIYAMKIVDKEKSGGRDEPPEHEVAVLAEAEHPNVVKIKEFFDFPTELYIIMELIEGGDLFDLIATETKFSETRSIAMTRDVASALAFLHSKNIVHRDIKPENLLVFSGPDKETRIKLGDFGLARIMKVESLFTVCGTPTYVAPEILLECGYGMKVDMWALGVIIYVLLCGFAPFTAPDQEALFNLITHSEYDFPSDLWDEISEEAKDLITHLLEYDPEIRYSAKEVLDHPWLTGRSLAEKSSAELLQESQSESNRIMQQVLKELGISPCPSK